jgi:putative membrane protein
MTSGKSSLSFLARGLTLLALSWVALSAIGFVVDQFGRGLGLGVLTLIAFGAALALLGWGIWIEARAYRSLRSVDALRAQFARADLMAADAKKSCQSWLGAIRDRFPDAAAVAGSISEVTTVAEVKNIMRTRVLGQLRQQANQIGMRAAIQGGAAVAITPSPALDGVLAGIRGVVVIRQVAQLYTLRPGLAVTIALLSRVMSSAAAVSVTELLSRSLTDQMLEVPYVKHLATAIPGASVAAIRLYRLACVTAEACSPLPG